MSADTILGKLQKVKRTSRDSWIACCPAHADRSPSMTIRELPDGRVLMHCFAGCGIDEILDAIGTDFTEIMPSQPSHISHFLKPVKQKFYPQDVLKTIRFEVVIVGIAAIDLKNGKTLSEEDHERLLTAIGRISEGVDYAS